MATGPRAEITTIYLVDDNDAVRRSLHRFFEAYGFAVRAYPSGEAFLAEVPTQENSCLILDFHLPGLNGLEILKRVRSQGWYLPVIVLTGNDDSSLEEQVLRLGVKAFLRKPFDLYDLTLKVIKPRVLLKSDA